MHSLLSNFLAKKTEASLPIQRLAMYLTISTPPFEYHLLTTFIYFNVSEPLFSLAAKTLEKDIRIESTYVLTLHSSI